MTRIILSLILVIGLLVLNIRDFAFAQEGPTGESLDKLKELSDFESWPGKTGPVRAGVRLSKGIIPILEGTTDIRPNRTPGLWGVENNLVRYWSRWQMGETIITGREDYTEDRVEIWIVVAETAAEAHEYLIERYFYTSLPFETRVPRRDQPNVAGDISFFGGRKFIRNNIVVEISVKGKMKDKLRQTAEQLDALLLTRPTAASAQQFKPVIERLELAQDTVEKGSSTRLFFEARDPHGGGLEYIWRMNGAGLGKDHNSETYYYIARYEVGVKELTLIVINDIGFASRASLTVTIVDSF